MTSKKYVFDAVTCNYDGVNKSTTVIGDHAFIGSNSSLVAPVEIGKLTTVGAGSVITNKIDDEQLAISRVKQRNISGWQRPKRGCCIPRAYANTITQISGIAASLARCNTANH